MARTSFLLVLALAAGCGAEASTAKTHDAAAPVAIKAAAVADRPTPRWLPLTGQLVADKESKVAADAAGKVLATQVERGQAVKAGQVLVSLDARSAALGARAARAQSEMARSQADLARAECERGRKLFEAHAITQTEYERRMAQCAATSSSVEAATANQQAAAKALGDATVRAPFDGIVGERFVDVGQYVRPDSPVVSLFATDPLRLELTVPESAVALVKEGLTVEFRVAAWPDQAFTGVIRFVSPEVRAQSRDLVVEALVENHEGKLRPGMFAAARLETGKETRPAVPSVALRKEGGDARLFVVVDGKAEERIVRILDERDGFAALAEGAKAGEQVILDPPPALKDGAPVEVK